MRLRLRPWRRRVLDVSVADDDLKRGEADVSRERQRRAREQVIRPLQELAEQNQFAELIRASLTQGRRRHR